MKKFNKLVSAALCGAMALSVVGCASADGGNGASTTEPSTTTPSTGETTPATNPNDVDKVEVDTNAVTKAEMPSEISVTWDGTIFKEGDNYAEAFYTALDSALGLHIKWNRPDHSSYSEQVGIMFTDMSTMSDVVILSSSLYAGYAAQGNLFDMTNEWYASETYNSGRLYDFADTVVNTWYTYGPDGQQHIYGMYPARGNGCVTYVKASAAIAAGYTQDTLPTTWAEYQDFLVALKNATGNAPVLAAGLVNSSEAPYTNYLPEFYQDAYPDFYFDEKAGQWVDGFNTEAMQAALERLNWAYNEGILDSDIFTNPSTSDVRNKFYEADTKTSIFTYWAGTWAYTIKSKLISAGGDGEVWMMKPIAELGAYTERISPMICITSACQNPSGVFQYFIDKILDGGDVQMLFQYGVEGTHYKWNDDHTKIDGLATEATAGTEKESKTSKNLFEANLKIGELSIQDPYTPADPIIDECFNLFNDNCVAAYKNASGDLYSDYKASLWQEKNELIAKVTKGEISAADAIAKYNETCGDISEAILEDLNN